jgi:hypothetical protein
MLIKPDGRLLARAASAACVFLLVNSSVEAQVAVPASSPAAGDATATSEQLERITVTGSLIPTALTAGALPVTTYDNKTLKDFGAANAIEALRSVPSHLITKSSATL